MKVNVLWIMLKRKKYSKTCGDAKSEGTCTLKRKDYSFEIDL